MYRERSPQEDAGRPIQRDVKPRLIAGGGAPRGCSKDGSRCQSTRPRGLRRAPRAERGCWRSVSKLLRIPQPAHLASVRRDSRHHRHVPGTETHVVWRRRAHAARWRLGRRDGLRSGRSRRSGRRIRRRAAREVPEPGRRSIREPDPPDSLRRTMPILAVSSRPRALAAEAEPEPAAASSPEPSAPPSPDAKERASRSRRA